MGQMHSVKLLANSRMKNERWNTTAWAPDTFPVNVKIAAAVFTSSGSRSRATVLLGAAILLSASSARSSRLASCSSLTVLALLRMRLSKLRWLRLCLQPMNHTS